MRLIFITSPAGAVAKYCDKYVSVCVSVCLSVYPRGYLDSGTIRAIFTDLFVHVAYCRSFFLLRCRCDTLCTSGFFSTVGRIAVWISLRRTDFA